MRLALFTDVFTPQLNGSSGTLERLVDETKARGGAVRVFTVSDPCVAPPHDRIVCRSPSIRCPFVPEFRVALPGPEARRLGVADDGIVVAYAGRIKREKGLDALLTTMACLRHLRSDVVFAFAGDGPYLDHCRRVAAGRVVFLGRLDDEALSAFYASSDIAVFPSSIDTFGNVLVESMASGLAVIAADCPTTRELLGAAGTFHTPGDGAQLANAILELAVNPARRNALARVARLRARRFDWQTVFDALFAEYDAVLAEPERVPDTMARRVHRSLAPQVPR